VGASLILQADFRPCVARVEILVYLTFLKRKKNPLLLSLLHLLRSSTRNNLFYSLPNICYTTAASWISGINASGYL